MVEFDDNVRKNIEEEIKKFEKNRTIEEQELHDKQIKRVFDMSFPIIKELETFKLFLKKENITSTNDFELYVSMFICGLILSSCDNMDSSYRVIELVKSRLDEFEEKIVNKY